MPHPTLELTKDKHGKTVPVDGGTGRRYVVTVSAPTLHLQRQYHDDSPVVGASFELELENGQVVKGQLDKNGKARVVNLPSPPKRIRFGQDAREYRAPEPPRNPEYRDTLSDAEAGALVQEHVAGQSAHDAKRKSIAGEAFDWVWGTVQGNFNDQQSVSQIITDAVISCIPLVGEVTDVRDLVAIVLGMIDDPKKREDKWEWLGLVVVLLALIPVAGGALKGVGKLLIRALKSGGKAGNAIASFIGALNKVGWGNALKWFKSLDLEKHTPELLGNFRKLAQRMDQVLRTMQQAPKWVLPDAVLSRLKQLREGLGLLGRKAEELIPESIKTLNRKLKEIQQQIYEGDWIPTGKAEGMKPKVSTRETEIKLEPQADGPGKLVVKNPKYPPSDPDIHYRKTQGWPNLKDERFMDGDKPKVIQSFSGTIRPVKLPPGTRIYRVLQHGSNPAGLFWSYKLPTGGKEWREEFAVLERWSQNGKYLEFVVPESGLVAWEGKVASQLDNVPKKKNGRPNPQYGQYLEGGGTQLAVDFEFSANRHARQDVYEHLWKDTHWDPKDLKGVHVPENVEGAERKLGELEYESRGVSEPFANMETVGGRLGKVKSLNETNQGQKE